MANIATLKADMEKAIDDMSVSIVLQALAEICHEKAEHVRAEWQDETTARWWERKAALVEKAREHSYHQDNTTLLR